ncbi:MAG: hypothetical protein ACOYO1_09145 [Bacteroidales bacterium]
MKKIFGLFLIAGMLVISACDGAKQDTPATDSTAVTETPVDTAAAVADTTTAPVK